MALDKDAVLQAVSEGIEIKDIAKTQNVSYQAIWNFLKRQRVQDAKNEQTDQGANLHIPTGTVQTDKRQVTVTELPICPTCLHTLEKARLWEDDECTMGYQCPYCQRVFSDV